MKKNPFADTLALVLVKKKAGTYVTKAVKNGIELNCLIADHIIWLKDPTSYERECGKNCLLIRKGSEFSVDLVQLPLL